MMSAFFNFIESRSIFASANPKQDNFGSTTGQIYEKNKAIALAL